MSFTDFALAPDLLRATTGSGYLVATPIQQAVIAAVLSGTDVLGIAQTGSGKTAAFVLPLLQHLLQAPARPDRHVRALVLVPTRELATQVAETVRTLARFLAAPPKLVALFGGVSVNPQMLRLRGGADEADRMLDAGFADELARVLALLPPQRQTLLFSATMPPAVEQLAQALMRAPLRVQIADDALTVPDIVQRAIAVDPVQRTQLLRQLIKDHAWKRVLVFVATQHAAETIAAKLYANGVYATPFHGGLSQGGRTQVLEELRNGQWDVVVTTDLAARGLDIAQLPVVVNYDLPRSAVDYVHRIGRTGRAGASGLALSFVSGSTEAHMRLIEKRQGMQLAREVIAGFEPKQVVQPDLAPVPGTGGIKGTRPSKKDKLRALAQQQGSAKPGSGTDGF